MRNKKKKEKADTCSLCDDVTTFATPLLRLLTACCSSLCALLFKLGQAMSVGWQYSGAGGAGGDGGDGGDGGGARHVDDGGGTCGVNYIKYVVAVPVPVAVAVAAALAVTVKSQHLALATIFMKSFKSFDTNFFSNQSLRPHGKPANFCRDLLTVTPYV
uniref:Uncharacterized protein n=1 Tax=Glossina pallidipes TaxID=7398 RepID=A0A1A9ZMU5_GLOPL